MSDDQKAIERAATQAAQLDRDATTLEALARDADRAKDGATTAGARARFVAQGNELRRKAQTARSNAAQLRGR